MKKLFKLPLRIATLPLIAILLVFQLISSVIVGLNSVATNLLATVFLIGSVRIQIIAVARLTDMFTKSGGNTAWSSIPPRTLELRNNHFIELTKLISISFCSAESAAQCEKNACCSGVSFTISPSAKNCDSVMPKPLQSARREGMVGSVLRFHIFEIVVWARPERLDNSYIVHPRSFISSLILHLVSI